MYRYQTATYLLCLCLILIVGCNQNIVSISQVTFDQLYTEPGKYNGKEITIEGFFFHGWEVTVLAERLEHSGYAPGHLVPRGRMMWIEGSIPLEVYNELYEQRQILSEKYGKVRMTGRFEYGAQFGHAGGYSSQIVPTEVMLLPWSPPSE